MPVKMRQIKKGKSKGKWVVVESGSGRRVYPSKGGTTRKKARSVVTARNLALLRRQGRKVPKRKERR